MSSQPKTPTGPQPGSRREHLQQQQEKQAKERKVRNVITFSILGVALVAIVGIIVAVAVSSQNAPQAANPATGQNNTIVLGDASAPVTVDVYQDYLCPACGKFDQTNGEDLQTLVADGKIKIEYHLMNFLDQQSQGTSYSSRAANAMVAIAKSEPDKVMAFNDALYANQPEENTPGLTDAQIADLARQAGVSEQVIATFAAKANQGFVDQSNAAALADFQKLGVRGTPSVTIDDQLWPPAGGSGSLFNPGELKAAIEQAVAAKGATAPSPSPSTTG